MLTKEYIVVAPKKIVIHTKNIEKIPENYYLVRTKYVQVCDADAKYYFGLRPKFPYSLFGFKYFFGIRRKKEFMKKYPLISLHEAVGVIEECGSNTTLQKSVRVVLIPTVACDLELYENCEYCSANGIGENYCPNSKFMSSNADGFARTYLLQPKECVIEIPKEVPDEIAIFCEISTVAYGSLQISNIVANDSVVIFGDGYMGYVLALLVHLIYKLPKSQLIVIGKHIEKLAKFEDFATVCTTIDTKNITPTKIFDCVGQIESEKIINTSIDLIKPGGKIILLGVCEEKIAINTRDIMSKFIEIQGVSRSSRKYYFKVLELMRDQYVQNLYRRILGDRLKINTPKDLEKAFTSFMVDRKKLLLELN